MTGPLLPNIFAYKHASCRNVTYQEARAEKITHAYIMCLKDGDQCDGMTKENITLDDLQPYTLIKVPINAIRSRHMLKLSKETALMYFPWKTFNSDDVLIYPTFLLTNSIVDQYAMQYTGISDISVYMNAIFSNKYMGVDNNSVVLTSVRIDMIRSMIESKFWVDPLNCNQNITLQFAARRFNLPNTEKVQNPEFQRIIKITEDYYLDKQHKPEQFIDPSMAIVKSGFRLYKLTPPKCKITNQHFRSVVTHLLKSNIKELYYFVHYTLASKDQCHLVLHNIDLLHEPTSYALTDPTNNTYNTFIQMFWVPFKYGLHYAWLCMYMEEAIKKTKASVDDRFVFTSDVVSHFPTYPFEPDDIKQSPYAPLLVNYENVKPHKNVMGININEFILNHKVGVVNSQQFKYRMNMFVSGRDIDIFEGVDWNDIGVTGSIMAACLPLFNPLMLHFSTQNGGEHAVNDGTMLVNFFNQYYKNADMDVMVSKSGPEYIDKVYEIYGVIQSNLYKFYPDCQVDITFKKTVTFVSKSNIEKDEAYDLYLTHMKLKRRASDDGRYIAIDEIVGADDMKIIVRDTIDDPFRVYDNIKFRISSPYMQREIELFSVKLSFIGTVSRFYLPIVRAFYDGSRVNMLPSCVTACMTFINLDYRYFAGTKDPIDVVNKYRFRGYGILMNESEISKFITYSKTVEPWKTSYNNMAKIRGYLDISSNFFGQNLRYVSSCAHGSWRLIAAHGGYYNWDDLLSDELYPISCVNQHGYTVPINIEMFDKFDFSILKKEASNDSQECQP